MGFISKIKNILFEEEEIEEPIKEVKKEEKKPVINRSFDDEQVKLEKAKEEISDKNETGIFEKEPSFNFPDFDEDEFASTMPKVKDVPLVNDYRETKPQVKEVKKEEPPKKPEYRTSSRGFSIFETTKSKNIVPDKPKKFKPSPIISPVYGILDKDYHPDDIEQRDDETSIKRANRLDLETVRKKAFAPRIKEIEIPEEPTIEEPEITIPEEPKKAITKKSVDELLAESAEEAVIVDEDLNVENNIKEIEDELDKISDDMVLDEKPKEKDEDDTLEQDLFELIDSMYDDNGKDE